MLLIYDANVKNSTAAVRFYAQKYPQRRHPTRKTFIKIKRQMRDRVANISVVAFTKAHHTPALSQISIELEINKL